MAMRDIFTDAKSKCETGWCQHHYARNERGEEINVNAATAVCWCADGAILAAIREQHTIHELIHYSDAITEFESNGIEPAGRRTIPITIWNDHPDRTQAEVVAAFERAIAAN